MKEIEICKGLTLKKEDDGHHLSFKDCSGAEVSARLERTHGDMGKKVILEWAKETLKEAEPTTSKYITKDIDWTGCDPEIKAFLLANPGKAIKCKCRIDHECDTEDDYITAYDRTEFFCYMGLDCNYRTVTPIIRKQRFLPFIELLNVLDSKGAVLSPSGSRMTIYHDGNSCSPIFGFKQLSIVAGKIYDEGKEYQFKVLPDFLTDEEA